MAGRSAIIAPVTLPAGLRSLREASDRMAAVGVPAHVTILFPFLEAEGLDEAERSRLLVIAGAARAFVAIFDAVERRDGMVWLLPADPVPFLALTAAVVDAWPDHPPYEGAHEELIAHLTLVETEDGAVHDRAGSLAEDHLPFDAAVTELWLISEGSAGRWRTRWRLPLAP